MEKEEKEEGKKLQKNSNQNCTRSSVFQVKKKKNWKKINEVNPTD